MKSTWLQKVLEVRNSFVRAKSSPVFIAEFYSNLFYLKPEIEKYCVDTKWKHQEIMIQKRIEHPLGFLDNDTDQFYYQNILRLSESHSHNHYSYFERIRS